LKANSKKNSGYDSGSKVGTFDEKKGGGKSHATVPLKGQEQGQGKNGGGKSHATVLLKGQ
jgi:hypothetical protein